MAMHKHLVYHTEAIKPNKLITADIAVFNEHDSTKLKEWLMEIETTAAMITPPSTVNMMSNEEDHCFQCQEKGHIA